MKGINDSSRKIADIISVIDGSPSQTNILALNAAVELRAQASRAGALRWWRAKYATWRNAAPRPPKGDQGPDWHQCGTRGTRHGPGGQRLAPP